MVVGFVSACGPGVYSALDPGPPLVTLHANVVTAAPQDTPSSGVKAAVLWAALPASVETCLAGATNTAGVVACAGTNFRPQLTTMTVPVEPAFPAAFELPVHEAPALGALGPSRFGYGLIVVLHDGNGNGRLDLVPAGEVDGPDRLLGTSLRADSDIAGDYLAYREGAEVPPSWNAFRLLAGCPDPPRGYFVIRLAQVGNTLTCKLDEPEAALTLELASTARVRAHACHYAPEPVPQAPPAMAPPAGSALQCWGPRSLEVVERPNAACRRVVRYDLGAEPAPAWWPCGPATTVLDLTPARAPLTADYDALFSLRFISGPGSFDILDLRVKVGSFVLKTLDSTVIVGRPTFTLDDRDSDGRFSAGDLLAVDEEERDQFTSAPAQPLPVEVWAESDGRVVPLGSGLSWTP